MDDQGHFADPLDPGPLYLAKRPIFAGDDCFMPREFLAPMGAVLEFMGSFDDKYIMKNKLALSVHERNPMIMSEIVGYEYLIVNEDEVISIYQLDKIKRYFDSQW
jgi:hypothetical protein